MCSIPVQYLRGSATIGPECPTKGDTKGFQLIDFITRLVAPEIYGILLCYLLIGYIRRTAHLPKEKA